LKSLDIEYNFDWRLNSSYEFGFSIKKCKITGFWTRVALSVDEVLNLEQNLNAQVTEDEKEKIRAFILARLAPKNHMLSPVDVQ
jgi:hypothetical protein